MGCLRGYKGTAMVRYDVIILRIISYLDVSMWKKNFRTIALSYVKL